MALGSVGFAFFFFWPSCELAPAGNSKNLNAKSVKAIHAANSVIRTARLAAKQSNFNKVSFDPKAKAKGNGNGKSSKRNAAPKTKLL